VKTPGLFITATDTDAGKTFVTALIARELTAAGKRVGVYKPACSGSVPGADGQPVWNDVEQLAMAVGGCDRNRVCPQRFEAALAPPVAAAREGKFVDRLLLRTGAKSWDGRADILLVEGVGGLLCPLTATETIADLAREFGYPLIIVTRLGLGSINHTLLTVEAALARGLMVAGIVCNETSKATDPAAWNSDLEEIARRSAVPVLSVVRHRQTEALASLTDSGRIDWCALAK
jgi:dethiobiotin synthetase